MSQYACDSVAQFKPTKDRILLRPLAWEPSKILEVVRFGRPLRGEVMAVGPGLNPIKYRPHPDGKRRIAEYSKRFKPTEVKVGDIVELGGLNIFDGQGYQFPEVVVGNERMLIVTERDVAMVVEEGKPAAMDTESSGIMSSCSLVALTGKPSSATAT